MSFNWICLSQSFKEKKSQLHFKCKYDNISLIKKYSKMKTLKQGTNAVQSNKRSLFAELAHSDMLANSKRAILFKRKVEK